MKLRYCIRTCDSRKELASQLFDILRDSLPPKTPIDIVNDYIGKQPIFVFGRYLKDQFDRGTDFDYLVTLEDDAVINDHLDFNLKNCLFMQEEEVGCLQLSISSLNDLKSPDTSFDREYKIFHRKAKIHYSCGLVFSKKLLCSFREKGIFEDMIASTNTHEFDIYVTDLCLQNKMSCSLHYPALVASLPNIPSAMGNTYVPSDELFSKSWKNDKAHEEYQKWSLKLKSHSLFCTRY
jgi:hypothetical protein